MMKANYTRRCIGIGIAIMMMVSCCFIYSKPVYAASSVNKENLVSNINNPENGVIKYSIKVPAGEKVDYSVELTPDKKRGTVDKITGSFSNKARKTVTKNITANVNFFSDKYKIKASYSKESKDVEIIYKDVDTIASSLKTSAVTSKVSWDFKELGKGNKEWKYRYKYEPYKQGFRKYVQIFDESGKQINNYVKQTISKSKVFKILKEMRAR